MSGVKDELLRMADDFSRLGLIHHPKQKLWCLDFDPGWRLLVYKQDRSTWTAQLEWPEHERTVLRHHFNNLDAILISAGSMIRRCQGRMIDTFIP